MKRVERKRDKEGWGGGLNTERKKAQHKSWREQITSNRLAMLSNDDVNEAQQNFCWTQNIHEMSKSKRTKTELFVRENVYKLFYRSISYVVRTPKPKIRHAHTFWPENETGQHTHTHIHNTTRNLIHDQKTTTTQCIMSIRCKKTWLPFAHFVLLFSHLRNNGKRYSEIFKSYSKLDNYFIIN